jgi:DNA-binding HxlR family transcriptional regulator
MRHRSFEDMDCSIARSLEIVGEWWSLLILREAFQRVRKFDDFQEKLGIARNVLTTRLNKLVENDILEKRLYQSNPDRFEYRLTEKGLDLYPVLITLMQWGDKWATSDSQGSARLTHKTCGHVTRPILKCDHCGDAVSVRDLTAELTVGPAYRFSGREGEISNSEAS